jgi:hypothetical protein
MSRQAVSIVRRGRPLLHDRGICLEPEHSCIDQDDPNDEVLDQRRLHMRASRTRQLSEGQSSKQILEVDFAHFGDRGFAGKSRGGNTAHPWRGLGR